MNIEFKIGKQDYKIKDVTIRDYYQIQTLLAQQGFDAKVQIVSQLSECPMNELKKLDKHQFLTLWNTLVDGPLDVSEKAPFHRNFVLNEKLYGFFDITGVTVGEFGDLEVLRAMPDAQRQLHKMMAIMYRPAVQVTEKWMQVEEYDQVSFEQRAEEFLDLPLKYVYGSLSFFLSIQNYLLESIMDSLMKEAKTKEEKEILEITKQLIYVLPEIGTTSSSTQLEMISQRSKRLNELVSLVSSTGLHINETNEKKKKPFKERMQWLINKIKIK